MALIKCPECGKEISDQAPACIHCGFPLDKMKKKPGKVILPRANAHLVVPSIVYFIVTLSAAGLTTSSYFWNITLFYVLCFLGPMIELVAIAGFAWSIIDLVKNNNRLEINLMEYDEQTNEIVLQNHRDKVIRINPSQFVSLEGGRHVYIYYKHEKKTRMFDLGFANKKDKTNALNIIKDLL